MLNYMKTLFRVKHKNLGNPFAMSEEQADEVARRVAASVPVAVVVATEDANVEANRMKPRSLGVCTQFAMCDDLAQPEE